MDSDLLVIQPGAADPIYRQIMAQLQRLVASGRLQPGEPLPSVREVAAHHAINPMTVSRAYGLLEAEGLLERQRGKGMVVAAQRRRTVPDAQRLRQLEAPLQEIARQTRELDLSPQSVLDRLRALLEHPES
ncbi:GntR family transcriptional regulator [Ideonella sp.]|uniref:GntR family transcriptional regulator n=1 Tax=Ideonella sp. TaxID=1929293 RepID=UPI003BB4CB7C